MSERTLKAASAANSRVPLRRSKLRRKTATSSSRPLSKPSTSHTALTKASAGVPSSSCELTTLITCNSLPMSVQIFQLRQPVSCCSLHLAHMHVGVPYSMHAWWPWNKVVKAAK